MEYQNIKKKIAENSQKNIQRQLQMRIIKKYLKKDIDLQEKDIKTLII